MSRKKQAIAAAIIEIARAEGDIAGVEEELFRFGRAVVGNDALRMALTDPKLPLERRAQTIDDLMAGKALDGTRAAANLILQMGVIGDVAEIADRVIAMSAKSRDSSVAEVRTAVALDDKQKDKLAKALAVATGKQLEIRVVIDPSVIGGVETRIGDLVFDGTVRSKLAQLKETVN